MPGLLSEMMGERSNWVAKKKRHQTRHRLMTAIVYGIFLVVAVFVIFNYSSIIAGLSETLAAK
jgi:hypothetical protein